MKRSKPEQDHTSGSLEAFREPVTMRPVGRVRSPYTERFGTPRQPGITEQVKGDGALEGTIEILPEYERGLAGLDGFSQIWVLYITHLNEGHRLEVKPPRGPRDPVGVFASRSPHHPNRIGLSCVRLVRVEGRTLHVLGLDMLDGTPVLDVKPYLPYADAFPDASCGWLAGEDPAAPDRFEPRT